MEGMSRPAGRWGAERDPRRHITADLGREKLSLHQIQCIIVLQGLLFFGDL